MVDFSKQPAVTGFKKVELNFPEPITLSNGVPVWVIGDGTDEVNRLDLYIGGGSYQESKPLLSLLTGMLALEGNEKMTVAEVSEAFDYYGALKSVQPFDSCTMVSLSSLNSNFQHTAEIFRDSIALPIFSERECKLHQQQIASNIAISRDRVEYMAAMEMKRLYYGANHPLAVEPTPELLMGITNDDYKRFHAQYYHVNNLRIIFSGRVTDKELSALDATIGAWDKQGAPLDYSKETPIEPSDKMLSVIDKKGALQSAVSIVIRAIPRRHPDYFKLRILITAFGGYFGSRLNMNIREDKGYTYGIHAYLLGKNNDAFIRINSSCASKYTWLLVEEVKKEMACLREELVSERELNIVKQYMLSDLMQTLDTPFSKARYMGDAFTCGLYPEYFNEHVDAILACTPADLKEMANKYLLADRMRIVIAGDKQKMTKD